MAQYQGRLYIALEAEKGCAFILSTAGPQRSLECELHEGRIKARDPLGDNCCGLVVSNYRSIAKLAMAYFSFEKWEENLEKICPRLTVEKETMKHFKFIVDVYLNSTSHLYFCTFMKIHTV